MTEPLSTLAVVFPGQGSQSVGMLSALAAAYPAVEETFAEVSRTLGYDLWEVVRQGPAERLNRTTVTQPAMLAAGVAAWRVWRAEGGPVPALMAGHSLGEYTALVCSGALPLGAAAALTEARGRLMQDAVPAGTGAMAAVLGLEDAQVRALCARAAQDEVLEAVNFNSPGQVVIAGHAPAVARALALAREAGARRAVPLPVSVPSHCRLMRDAAAGLRERLREVTLVAPDPPVIHNADVRAYTAPDEIRAALARQLDHPVRWVETVCAMAARGIRMVVECGPGRVLSGLSRRIDKRLQALPVEDPETLRAALDAVRAANGEGGRRE